MKKIYKIINDELEGFDNNSFIRLLKIFSVASLLIILYAFLFSGFQIVDEFEHLHAAWLVSIGEIPYVDFFEHHNPLLWYLFAPVVNLFYNNVMIFYVMRLISLFISLLTLFYIYKITLFWGNKESGWFAIALTLGNIITLYNFYQFRPDNFMNLCFIIGIYYLFCHLKEKRNSDLIYSFLGFTFSFLFLQKIALLLIVVEGILLWLLITKKIPIKKFVIAVIPSLTIIFGCLFYLYFKGNLFDYYVLNFEFNKALVYYFSRGNFWLQSIFISIYGIALVVSIYYFKKQNIYFKITSILFISEFLMRGFYFSPHPNYYTLLTFLSSLILSIITTNILKNNKILSFVLIITLFVNLGHLFNKIEKSVENRNSYNHFVIADYIHKNSGENDYLMNGYDMNFNIYRKDVSYYWFGLDMLLPIIEREYGFKNQVNINELILKYRPKFIYTKDYLDLFAYRAYGETKFTQQYIPEIIDNLYTSTPFDDVVMLK
ncbi:MAG: glycosyltransferase family 39 protein [Alphaproteobacteria bacterium]|nr:glycosyltransferase family 39 protein [Alphaproteobacteria bacterium]